MLSGKKSVKPPSSSGQSSGPRKREESASRSAEWSQPSGVTLPAFPWKLEEAAGSVEGSTFELEELVGEATDG